MSQERDPLLKASELIAELQKAIKQHGDLHVRVWADHGQEYIGVPRDDVGVCYLHKDEKMSFLPDTYHEDDVENDDPDIVKQIVIHSIA